MNNKIITIILLLFLSGCSKSDFLGGRTSDFWNTSGNILEPTNSSYKLQVPSLANCDTIDTDSDGLLACGVDGGGSSLWATSTLMATNIYYSTGNVGIGTSTPNYKLTVYGTSSFSCSIG